MINKTLKVESMNTKQKRSVLSKILDKLYAVLVSFAQAKEEGFVKKVISLFSGSITISGRNKCCQNKE